MKHWNSNAVISVVGLRNESTEDWIHPSCAETAVSLAWQQCCCWTCLCRAGPWFFSYWNAKEKSAVAEWRTLTWQKNIYRTAKLTAFSCSTWCWIWRTILYFMISFHYFIKIRLITCTLFYDRHSSCLPGEKGTIFWFISLLKQVLCSYWSPYA